MRAARWTQEPHACFFWRPVTFPVVTANAGADQILPAIGSPTRPRYDMVYGQRHIRCSTVLALEAIAPHDIAPCEFHVLVRHADGRRQPNHAGQWIESRHTPQHHALADLHHLGFRQDQQVNSFFDRADADRFVSSVEHQHFLGERIVVAYCGIAVPVVVDVPYGLKSRREGKAENSVEQSNLRCQITPFR